MKILIADDNLNNRMLLVLDFGQTGTDTSLLWGVTSRRKGGCLGDLTVQAASLPHLNTMGWRLRRPGL